MTALSFKKVCICFLLIIFFFCTPINASSEDFSAESLSPESLRKDLQTIAGDEDISWITEDNLPFVHTPNSHLHSLLVDYAIVREINSEGLQHDQTRLIYKVSLAKYLPLYNVVGEGMKLYMGDLYVDSLKEKITSDLLETLSVKGTNWLGNSIEDSLNNTQSNLVKSGWGKYKKLEAIAKLIKESPDPSSVEFIESLWNLSMTFVGNNAAGAAAGAYMNFLFSTIDIFKKEATENRILLYAALCFNAKNTDYFSDPFNELREDIAFNPLSTFLSQPHLNSTSDLDTQEITIVFDHLNAINNAVELDPDAIKNILKSVGPGFVSFIDTYLTMLEDSSANSWAGLETELYDLIHAEIQRANYIRYNYSYRGDDIDKKSVLLAYNGTDTFYLLNNSSERLHNTYLLDTDWINEDTNHKNIAPEEYTFFQVEEDNLPEEFHYTLFNVPDHFQLTTDDFKGCSPASTLK